ncbi:unnamed protein product [Rotaria sp. Silwood1]|nr:unnamed protein product [Rotaria sp. Silwood1]CAF3752906.1 unnamed protein product [Rotaria sp. Silwood1]CAF3782955.1 unnamed protein product [Rotaria sp. Silwood1]
MSGKFYHGDPSRNNNFWVYPRNQALGATSTSRVFYHGDPSRNNNFWVYPREKALITRRWDTYNADDLCNNYTYVETIAFGIRAYRCNGHGTASGGGLSQDQAQFYQLISDIKLIARKRKQEPNEIDWDGDIRRKIPELVAYIFALWRLKNVDHYFEAEDLDNRNNYLLLPHATQVIAIFRIFGIGNKKEQLKNNLVEIGTSERKSITLGVTACILVLLGFDVCCACYIVNI